MGPPTIVWDIPIRWPILFLECLRVSRRLGSGGRCYTLEKHAGDNVSKSAFYPTLQLKCSIIFEWFTVLIPRNNLVPGVTSATTPQSFVRRLQFLDVNLCFHMINNWRKFSNQVGMDTTFVMWTGYLCAIHRFFYVNCCIRNHQNNSGASINIHHPGKAPKRWPQRVASSRWTRWPFPLPHWSWWLETQRFSMEQLETSLANWKWCG